MVSPPPPSGTSNRYRSFYELFVNPNASCPKCGNSVFFYQSRNGGRVFFDELGPPWPKHPCTAVTYKPKGVSQPRVSSKRPQWEIKKWKPVLDCKLLQDPELDKCYQLTGIVEADAIDLFPPYAQRIQVFIRASLMSIDMTFTIRNHGRNEYEISGVLVDINGNVEVRNFTGHTSRERASEAPFAK